MDNLSKILLFFLIVVFLFQGNLNASIDWTPHAIGSLAGIKCVYATDFDRDSDVDVIGVGWFWDEEDHIGSIAWWENDGSQNFTGHYILTYMFRRAPQWVHPVDLDNDNDTDILVADGDYGIIWYENISNLSFIEHMIIPIGAFNGACCAYDVDLDEDGDIDVVACAYYAGFAWLENDGNQNFTVHWIAGFRGVACAYPSDIDNDGDWDLVTAAKGDNQDVSWWENDGNENFTYHGLLCGRYESVYALDMDNDFEIDIAAAGQDISLLYNDGNQNFNRYVPESMYYVFRIYPIDVDNDNDIDLFGTVGTNVSIAWYERIGELHLDYRLRWIEHATRHETCLHGADIDSDGDIDAVGVSYGIGIVWWESDLIGVEEEDIETRTIDLGPTILRGPLVLPKDKNCKVFDITGRVVAPDKVKPGIYFIEIEGVVTQKVIKIK